MEAFRKKETDLIETQAKLAENIKAEQKAYFELGVAGGKVTDALTEKTMKHVAAIIAQRQAILEAGAAATKVLGDRSLGGAANRVAVRSGAQRARRRLSGDRAPEGAAQENGRRPLTQDEEMAFQALAAKVEADFDDASQKIRAGGDKVGDSSAPSARRRTPARSRSARVFVAERRDRRHLHGRSQSDERRVGAYLQHAMENMIDEHGVNFNGRSASAR
jgi:hypothetical protein